MKLQVYIIFLAFLFLPTLGQREVNCTYFMQNIRTHRCIFRGVTLDRNERITIVVQPEAARENITLINYVEFSGSSIYQPPREVFSKFPNLLNFIVRTQWIQDIPAGTFVNARNIQSFQFAGNHVYNDYLNNVFQGAGSMITLNMNNCSLREINPSAFKGLFWKSVKNSNYLNNQWFLLIFKELVNLETIDLVSNQLRYLHRDAFKYNLRLRSILLRSNRIISLWRMMFNHLDSLQSVDLLTNICVSANIPGIPKFNFERVLMVCHNSYEIHTNELAIKRLEEKVDKLIGM